MNFRERNETGKIVSWWSVEPSGDYLSDCYLGSRYADQFMKALVEGEAMLALPHIVSAFPKELTGIEIGFLHGISDALMEAFRPNTNTINFPSLRVVGSEQPY